MCLLVFSLLDGPWSSWLNNTSWVLFVASIGGAIVSMGLWLELGVEKDQFKHLSDFRRQHSKEKLGMKLVMAGVILESVFGGILACHDAEENRKNDPLNVPIKSVRADVLMLVRGPFNDNLVESQPRMAVNMILLESGSLSIVLGCKSLESWKTLVQTASSQTTLPTASTNPHGRWFSMEFDWPGDVLIRAPDAFAPPVPKGVADSFRYLIDRNNVSVAQLDKEKVTAILSDPSIPDKADILSGSCVITFNGVQRRFAAIPKTGNFMLIKLGPMTSSP